MACIVVHGGCGTIPPEELEVKQPVVDEAAEAGLRVLDEGGTALDAVEAAVRLLEDHEAFNAGTGSVLTLYGTVEMDASVMTSTLECGAVAAVQNVRHPVTLARRVMEETDHVLLSGEGAGRFASLLGMPAHDAVTPQRRQRWRDMRDSIERSEGAAGPGLHHWKRMSRWLQQFLSAEERGARSTVGAVARDDRGLLAAATSTGGIWLKLPGRVGDTPIIGAGTYASPLGAASATGHGEGIMKLCLAQRAVALMETMSAQQAASRVVDDARRHEVECGVITMDARGGAGSAFNVAAMPASSRGACP